MSNREKWQPTQYGNKRPIGNLKTPLQSQRNKKQRINTDKKYNYINPQQSNNIINDLLPNNNNSDENNNNKPCQQ